MEELGIFRESALKLWKYSTTGKHFCFSIFYNSSVVGMYFYCHLHPCEDTVTPGVGTVQPVT